MKNKKLPKGKPFNAERFMENAKKLKEEMDKTPMKPSERIWACSTVFINHDDGTALLNEIGKILDEMQEKIDKLSE